PNQSLLFCFQVFDLYDPDYNQPRRSVRIVYGTQRRQAFCIRHFELLECSPTHTERVVSFEDLRLDLSASMANLVSLGGPVGGGSSTSILDTPSSIDGRTVTTTTSGHDSTGLDRSSTTT